MGTGVNDIVLSLMKVCKLLMIKGFPLLASSLQPTTPPPPQGSSR